MTPKEFKLWRDRLVYAKNVWVQKGLLGSGASTMRLLIELNRGNQWEHLENTFRDLDEEMFSTVNKIFPIANAIVGEVASRNPRVQVFPNHPDAIEMARPVEHLLNQDIKELGFKRQSNRALRHHLWAPLGIMQHGFTPRDEWVSSAGRRMQMYRPSRPDRPWVRAVPIWNVLMDPTGESFHVDDGMEWVAFRELMRLEDIKDNPNMISRSELGDFAGNISPDWERWQTDRFEIGDEDPDKNEYVEVFTVYEAREQTWFQMTLDGIDKLLREESDWPIPWETLPVSVFQVNEQMDTPFPLAIMEELADPQIEINKLHTMMGQLVFRLRRILGYNKAGLEDSEVAKIEDASINEMIAFKGDPAEGLKMISSGVFPGQDLLQYRAVLDEDMRETVGVSKMGRGQRINVESASEATFVQQGQDINTQRISDAFEDFNRDVIRLYSQGRRATMAVTGEEVVRMVGEQDADGALRWATVTAQDLHADYALEIVHGSTRKRDKAEESRQAAADFQIAMSAPQLFKPAYFARRLLEARAIPPEQGMTKEALVASAVLTLDQIRRDAQIGEEGSAEPAFSPNVAALTGGQQGPAAPGGANGGGAGQ
jgi:hypothetical protein